MLTVQAVPWSIANYDAARDLAGEVWVHLHCSDKRIKKEKKKHTWLRDSIENGERLKREEIKILKQRHIQKKQTPLKKLEEDAAKYEHERIEQPYTCGTDTDDAKYESFWYVQAMCIH